MTILIFHPFFHLFSFFFCNFYFHFDVSYALDEVSLHFSLRPPGARSSILIVHTVWSHLSQWVSVGSFFFWNITTNKQSIHLQTQLLDWFKHSEHRIGLVLPRLGSSCLIFSNRQHRLFRVETSRMRNCWDNFYVLHHTGKLNSQATGLQHRFEFDEHTVSSEQTGWRI